MNKNYMTNLDVQCAELGRKLAGISGIEEKTINAALAVLEEHGPYAMFLYLQARQSNVVTDINNKALNFLRGIFSDQVNGANNILEAIKKPAENLDDLLFARHLLRMALSYARYHLKARGGDTS